MAGIGIITNPHSKLNKRNPKRSKLLSFIAGSRGKLEITNNLEELRRVAKNFKANQIETLAINGGDGTISRTLSAFIQEYGSQKLPEIAVLRGGTLNMLADNLGISGNPELNLYKLVKGHALKDYMDTVELDTLRVDNNYGFLLANASSVRFLEEFYRRKTTALGSVFLILRALISFCTLRITYNRIVKDQLFTLSAKGQAPIRFYSPIIFCSTVQRLPLRVPLFALLKGRRGFQSTSILSLANRVPFDLLNFLLSRPAAKKKRLDILKAELTVKAESSSLASYTIDGELFYPEKETIRVALGPRIRFIIL